MAIVLNSLKNNGSFQELFYCKFKKKINVRGNMLWEGITSMTNTSYSQQNMLLSLHPKSSEKTLPQRFRERELPREENFHFQLFLTLHLRNVA